MTEEYDSYIFYTKEDSLDALKEKLEEVCEMSKEDLRSFGERARDFILRNKTAKAQCKKILDFIGFEYNKSNQL
jgi:hypothetical protein